MFASLAASCNPRFGGILGSARLSGTGGTSESAYCVYSLGYGGGGLGICVLDRLKGDLGRFLAAMCGSWVIALTGIVLGLQGVHPFNGQLLTSLEGADGADDDGGDGGDDAMAIQAKEADQAELARLRSKVRAHKEL